MDDLITWLKAQIDDDEEAAGAAKDDEFATATGIWREVETPAGRRKVVDEFGYSVVEDDRYVSFSGDVSAQPWHSIPHVARHDPARVLREVQAKRRLVDLYAEARQKATDYREDYTLAGARPWSTKAEYLEVAVRLAALPFSDRPGYQDSWRP